ncbi:hypothetical protein ACTRXD_16925 [Nitrospira sp. T9]|uniref:hypothetical protein n=1 Tax=unclassified Nitrospira TaxID=2652172 RepID=UPI003F9E3911
MSNDLRKAINDARRAAKGIPSKTLLGKAVYRSIDSCEAAYRCNDKEAVNRELASIQQLLNQS